MRWATCLPMVRPPLPNSRLMVTIRKPITLRSSLGWFHSPEERAMVKVCARFRQGRAEWAYFPILPCAVKGRKTRPQSRRKASAAWMAWERGSPSVSSQRTSRSFLNHTI